MLRLAVTPGEPAGIGPEILLRLVAEPALDCELVAICDRQLLCNTAEQLGIELSLVEFKPDQAVRSGAGRLTTLHTPLNAPHRAGQLNTANATYVLETLRRATDLCMNDALDGLVTGPVHKGIINDAGIAFSGHTEFLAQRSNNAQVVMMLACEGLRVALLTTHIPLREVADAITAQRLASVLRVLHHDLVHQFGLEDPRILICGLNPHAGEGGHLGTEELDIMLPTIQQLRLEQGWRLSDPLPADTLFTEHHLSRADAVLAMYHDQGLPVLKHKGFGASANITLGLPFIRTSVDHGTALDLAGKGTASTGSLRTALNCALHMASQRRRTRAGK